MSIHYLPEHVRNGDANKFTPFFSLENFTPQQTDIRASSPSGVMLSDVGAVFLVRSPRLPDIGEHYILITGGQVQTPRGMRREDIVYLPAGAESVLEDTGELQIYEVHGEARKEFYEKAKVHPKYRLK